ncbi:SH3 domain-containing protein [Intestinibacter sp.]|uniref:SH3 domain-containing protein n=1 Tax=Intestinibacter sp. TaxID=1965304 RepID=UPI003F1413FD
MRGIDKVILGSLITASMVGINYNISSADKIEQTTYITTNRLNMRKGPGTGYAKIGTLNQGEKVVAIEKSSDGKWVKIKYNSQEAWVSLDYLKKEETQSTTNEIKLNSNYKTTGNLNMRTGASTSYSRIATLPLGTVVTPTKISADGEWVQVKYNNQTGWISVKYIKLDETTAPIAPEEPSDKPDQTGKKYKTTGNLNMRKGPGTSYARITTLPMGTVVTPISFSTDGGWAQVKYNNQTGWISVKYIKLDETSTPITPEEPSDKPDEETQKFSGKYITTANLTLRKGPGQSYQGILTIPEGTKIEATEITLDENWLKVTYSGQTGWVNSDYLNEADTVDEEDTNPDYEVPSQALGDDFYTTSAVYFRVSDSSTSSLISQIPKNTKVTLIKFNSDASWAQVIYNNKTGWVLAYYLNDEPLGSSGSKDETSEDTGTYRQGTTKENLNLRKGPSTSYSVLVTIPKNSTVEVYEEQNGWVKVKYNSYTGYCSALYIK